jgi:arylsulfatase A-like enzyme
MDSLNRHYLNAYGESWVQTPNLDRLAARGLVFDRHYAGSLPCMPARREMMTGRHNFLEAPWGPVEPWDVCLPPLLHERDVYTHMITDHYHYFHRGGYGYYDLFQSWEFVRGQESDRWHPFVEPPRPPENVRGRGARNRHYWANRACRDVENPEEYSTPQCFHRALSFLDRNHDAGDWHLHLEVFDPHEPFECPQRYRDLYGDTWDRYPYDWPDYAPLDPERDDEEAVAHIRRCYAGTLTMVDEYLGLLLDKLDEHDLWDEVTVILTTDHGHLLGEHGYWAKNYMFVYEELAHIPLFVAGAGVPQGRRRGLTCTLDLMPTLLELHGAAVPEVVRGRSLLPLLAEDGDHHEAVLYGYFASDVHLTDGRYTYCRQPAAGATVHQHTATPADVGSVNSVAALAEAEVGPFLPATAGEAKLYRWPRPSHTHRDAPAGHLVYDLESDPRQETPLQDPVVEERLTRLLIETLRRHDAPACQYERLGLAPPEA